MNKTLSKRKRPMTTKSKAGALSLQEFRALLAAILDEPFHTMLIAAGCVGLRGGELGLNWGDFTADGTLRRSANEQTPPP